MIGHYFEAGSTTITYAAAVAFVGLAWLLSRSTPADASTHVPLLIFAISVLASATIGGQRLALF